MTIFIDRIVVDTFFFVVFQIFRADIKRSVRWSEGASDVYLVSDVSSYVTLRIIAECNRLSGCETILVNPPSRISRKSMCFDK